MTVKMVKLTILEDIRSKITVKLMIRIQKTKMMIIVQKMKMTETMVISRQTLMKLTMTVPSIEFPVWVEKKYSKIRRQKQLRKHCTLVMITFSIVDCLRWLKWNWKYVHYAALRNTVDIQSIFQEL